MKYAATYCDGRVSFVDEWGLFDRRPHRPTPRVYVLVDEAPEVAAARRMITTPARLDDSSPSLVPVSRDALGFVVYGLPPTTPPVAPSAPPPATMACKRDTLGYPIRDPATSTPRVPAGRYYVDASHFGVLNAEPNAIGPSTIVLSFDNLKGTYPVEVEIA